MNKELLRFEHISTINAKILADINLNIFKGNILGLICDNLTEKNALIDILTGRSKGYNGKIYFKEKEVYIKNIRDSLKLGIYCIFQQLNLASNLSIAENIFMLKNKLFYSKEKINQKAQEIIDMIGLDKEASTVVKNLTYSEKQIIELAKAFAMDSKLIIFDDSVYDFNYKSFRKLKNIIEKFKAMGLSFLFISNRIDEIMEISDRITIIRQGYTVWTMHRREYSKDKIITLIVGDEFYKTSQRVNYSIGENILELRNVFTDKLKNISLSLKKGEILSITGFEGSGKIDLIKVLYGFKKIDRGSYFIEGELANIKNPHDAISRKICYVPDNINRYSLMSNLSIKENIRLSIMSKIPNIFNINKKYEKFIVEKYIREFNINVDSIEKKVEDLRLEDQKKLAIVKCLLINPKIIILKEPTRGLGIKDKKDINNIIKSLAEKGIGVIIISSEIKELSVLSNRVILLRSGEIICELSYKEISQNKILRILNKLINGKETD